MFLGCFAIMMPKGQYLYRTSGCKLLGKEPAPDVCATCIEASSGAVSNTDRMLARGRGETIGVKLQSASQVRDWMDSLDRSRCPCFPVDNP